MRSGSARVAVRPKFCVKPGEQVELTFDADEMMQICPCSTRFPWKSLRLRCILARVQDFTTAEVKPGACLTQVVLPGQRNRSFQGTPQEGQYPYVYVSGHGLHDSRFQEFPKR